MKEIAQLIADCKMSRKRLLGDESIPQEMRRELADNVWPWLEAMARVMDQELDIVHAEMAALYVEQDTMIDADLGASILGLFDVGRQLAQDLEQRVKESGDEVAIKRTVQTIHDYVRATHAVGEAVEAAMARYVDAEGADDGEDDGTDSDGEADTEGDNQE